MRFGLRSVSSKEAMILKCSYCLGNGFASVYVQHTYDADFGEVTTPKRFIANARCRHCSGTGKCARHSCHACGKGKKARHRPGATGPKTPLPVDDVRKDDILSGKLPQK